MKLFIILSFVFISLSVDAAPVVKVIGLFKDKALVNVDGESKLMRRGQLFKNFILEYADSKRAIISFDGESKEYKLSATGGSLGFKKAKSLAYHIQANPQGMYFTKGSINGKIMEFVIDTGASMVSMNRRHAESLGIDVFKEGIETTIATASANVRGYLVKLKTVKIGDIQLNNIDATVLLSEQPDKILLGMSFLKHLKIKHAGDMMTLNKN